MKKCGKCNNLFKLKFFYKDSTHKDGYRSQCKNCDKKYRLEHKEEMVEKRKLYNLTHKQERKEYNLKNRKKIKKYLKKYYLKPKNKKRRSEWMKQNYLMNKKEISQKTKIRGQLLKKECFNAYGGCVCRCCGEKELPFLSLDHVNNDGAKERKNKRGVGAKIYRYLKKNNYPDKHRYQVLCMNCQWGKRFNNICPHKKNEKM